MTQIYSKSHLVKKFVNLTIRSLVRSIINFQGVFREYFAINSYFTEFQAIDKINFSPVAAEL